MSTEDSSLGFVRISPWTNAMDQKWTVEIFGEQCNERFEYYNYNTIKYVFQDPI
jgi:hypothetical protein